MSASLAELIERVRRGNSPRIDTVDAGVFIAALTEIDRRLAVLDERAFAPPVRFVECDACRAKPGTPVLCDECLRRRAAWANDRHRANIVGVVEPIEIDRRLTALEERTAPPFSGNEVTANLLRAAEEARAKAAEDGLAMLEGREQGGDIFGSAAFGRAVGEALTQGAESEPVTAGQRAAALVMLGPELREEARRAGSAGEREAHALLERVITEAARTISPELRADIDRALDRARGGSST